MKKIARKLYVSRGLLSGLKLAVPFSLFFYALISALFKITLAVVVLSALSALSFALFSILERIARTAAPSKT